MRKANAAAWTPQPSLFIPRVGAQSPARLLQDELDPESNMTRTPDGAPRRGQSHSLFERMSSTVTRAVGTSWAFGIAIASVVIWALTGPIFHYSDYWQLVINTGTTIVTFLMVFLIQQAQNKDSVAIHLKLNELLASHRAASNRLVAIEDLDEAELNELRAFYCRLAARADTGGDGIEKTHSLAEADAVAERKIGAHKPHP